MILRRLFALFSLLIALGSAHATDTATFDAATNRLTLSRVEISGTSSAFTDVVLQLTGFGTVSVNDSAVGSSNTFDTSTYALYLPTVTIGSQSYSKVSLKGLAFVVVSFGGIDAGTSSNYNLDLVITASGVTTPAIRVANVPKPTDQSDFCADSNYETFKQNVQGFSGSWSITSCSFNGTSGTIAAQLTITSPIAMSLPYSVTYTYSQ